MTFRKPRYNKNFEYELLRLCTKSGSIVYGGVSKLFKYFLQTSVATSIISYCDNSKFSGKIYKELGFTLERISIAKHWVRLNPFKHFTDNLVRQKGVDSLLGTHFGKGMLNETLLLSMGFLPIYDVGQAVYVINNYQERTLI